jgi:hypothetical protein
MSSPCATDYYAAHRPWTTQVTSHAAPSFGVSQPRFVGKATEVPGPGTYDPSGALVSRTGAAHSLGARHPSDPASDVPGPGAYHTPGTLLKRTFNVTMGVDAATVDAGIP